MKRLWIIKGGIVGALVAAMVMSLVRSAEAQAAFPKFARQYIVYFGRAMDECNPTTLTVLSPPNLPAGGCFQANTATDDQLTMGFSRVYLHENGRIIVVGGGFAPNPVSAKLEMTLRVTRDAVPTNMGMQTVTFPDLIVQCPTSFTSQPDGSIYDITSLTECLGPANSGLATGTSNIDVISVSLLNAGNGDKVFGRPGILR